MGDLTPLTARYLLVSTIPVHVDRNGTLHTQASWAKDLREHSRYITNLTVACPRIQGTPPMGSSALPEGPRISFVNLSPHATSFPPRRGFLMTATRLWRAVGRADIVHVSVGGRADIFVVPMALLRRRFVVVVVESSSWRIPRGIRSGIARTAVAQLSERLHRWCVGCANLALFTHGEYRDTLLRVDRTRGHVIPASWVDADSVPTRAAVELGWRDKTSHDRAPLRVVYCGRLTREKGVHVLLQAMEIIGRSGGRIEMDIIGSGELRSPCERAAAAASPPLSVRLLGDIEYNDLLDRLASYHVALVPSLSDEQPRVVYDAFSRGVPVIASDTAGLRDEVQHGVTGFLVPPNNARALATLVCELAADPTPLATMGTNAAEVARTTTHREMHKRRHQLLSQMLAQRSL